MAAGTGNITAFLDLYSAGFESGLQKAAAQSKKFADDFTRSQVQAQNASGAFGARAANVAHQVQDMAVQFQSGTRAATILAQQLPQLASAFGTTGAIIGTVIGVGAVVASTFLNIGTESDKAGTLLDNFSDVLDKTAGKAKQLAEQLATAGVETRKLMAELAEQDIQALETQLRATLKTVTAPIQQRAEEEAARIAGSAPSPFGMTPLRERLPSQQGAGIIEGVETARTRAAEVRSKAIDRAVELARAGKTEELNSVINSNKLNTESSRDFIDNLLALAQKVHERNAFVEAAKTPIGQPLPTGPGSLVALGAGPPKAASPVRSPKADIEADLEASQRLARAYAESDAAGQKMQRTIEAEQRLRSAGIDLKSEDAKKLIELTLATKQNQDAADNSKLVRQLQEEHDKRAALLKDVNKVRDASREQEAAAEAEIAIRRSGIDVTTEAGKQILQLAKSNAVLNVRLDEQQKIEGRADSGIAKREKRIETVDFEIEMTQMLIAAVRQSDQAYANAQVEVDALRAAHALGAEATEAERQAVYENTKERQRANAILKEEIALRDAAIDRQQLIAQGKLTPIRYDASGKPLSGTPATQPIVNTQEIEEQLGIGKNAQEHADQYTDAWKTALEDLQGIFTDTFEQIFRGQLNSAKEFSEQLKSIVARGLANMLSGAIFGGGLLGGGAGGVGGGQAGAAAIARSLAGLLGGSAPVANYSAMTQAQAQRRIAQGPYAYQAPWQAPGTAARPGFQTLLPQLAGPGMLALAGIGGMLGGSPGQFSPAGFMSTFGTGAMMGHGLGLTYGAGGLSMLGGTLAGRMTGGGLFGAGAGGLTGAAIGGFLGGPIGALGGGLLGSFGGFLGGGDKQARNRAGFSFNPLTGATRQDKSPGLDDPNRQAALQLVRQLQELTATLKGAGVSFRGGTIGSSVSRTQTAEEAMQSLLRQLRSQAIGGSIPVQKALKRSQATTPEGLIEDVRFAQQFEVMIRLITPFQAKMRELNGQFAQAAVKARELGLNEGALMKARDRARAELFAQREAEANALRGQLGIIGPFEARMRELQEAFRQASLRASELGLNVENLADAQRRAIENLAQERENAANALRSQMGLIDETESGVRQVDANVFWGINSAKDLGIDPNEIRAAGERQKAEIRKQAAEIEAERKRALRQEALAIKEQLGIFGPWEARMRNLNEAFDDARRRADELNISEKEISKARKRAIADLEHEKQIEADRIRTQTAIIEPWEAQLKDLEEVFYQAAKAAKELGISEADLTEARERSFDSLERQRISEADAIKAQLGVFTPYESKMRDLVNAFDDARANLAKYWLTEKEVTAARARAMTALEHQRSAEATSLRAQLGIIGPWQAKLADLEETFYQAGLQAKDLRLSESELQSARTRALAELERQRQLEAAQVRAQLGIIGPYAAQLAELEEAFRQARANAADLGLSENELNQARTRALADLTQRRTAEYNQVRAQVGIIGAFESQFRQLEETFYQAGRVAAELGISEAELASARARAFEDLRQLRNAEADSLRAQLGVIGEYAGRFRALEETFRQASLRAADLGISEFELSAARAQALEDLRRQRLADRDAILAQTGIISPFEASMRQLEEMFYQASRRAQDLGISEAELAAARTRAIEELNRQRDDQLRQAEEQLRSSGDQLRSFVDQLVNPLKAALSPQGIFAGILAPRAAANDNMEQFRRTLQLARGDNVEAIQNLPAVAQAAVEAARRYGGSGPEFAKLFREIEAGLRSVLDTQQTRQEDIMNETPEAVRRSAADQIAVMREEFARLREEMEGLRRDMRLRAAA